MVRILVCILLLGSFATTALAADPVRIGIFHFPPFYSKPDGEPARGVLVELARRHFYNIGREVEFELLRTPEVIAGVKNGHIDVAMLIQHPDLRNGVIYSKKAISEIRLVSFRRKETSAIKSYRELVGKTVLAIDGYGYAGTLARMKRLTPAPKLISVSDISSGIDLLLVGRGDYFLSYLNPSLKIAVNKGLGEGWLVADPLFDFKVHWVISEKAKDAKKLARELDELAR